MNRYSSVLTHPVRFKKTTLVFLEVVDITQNPNHPGAVVIGYAYKGATPLCQAGTPYASAFLPFDHPASASDSGLSLAVIIPPSSNAEDPQLTRSERQAIAAGCGQLAIVDRLDRGAEHSDRFWQ